MMENSPKAQYHLAVEPNPSSLKQIVKALANKMGTGKVVETSKEEAFLYNEITVTISSHLHRIFRLTYWSRYSNRSSIR